MSLKGVHLVFIVASIALAAMMGVWGIWMFATGRGSLGHVAFSGFSLVAGAALVAYAVKFVRKSREIGLR